MPPLAGEILRRAHNVNPYEGFEFQGIAKDVTGSGGHEMLRAVFERVKPRIIVEVGSWKGASAMFWADMLRKSDTDGVVICVDTWLGGLEHINGQAQGWDIRPYYSHGFPQLYYQFLANIMHEKLDGYIVPLPTTSLIGARWVKSQAIVPDIVYLDGSHEDEDVTADLNAYWKLLRPGGCLCGDDWSLAWPSVVSAVFQFSKKNKADFGAAQPVWCMEKPGALSVTTSGREVGIAQLR